MNLRSVAILSFVVWSSLSACKETPAKRFGTDDNGRKQFSDLYATGQAELRGKSNFFYALFQKDYELRFDALPLTGSVDSAKIPYSGSWYPEKTGGTAREVGGLSPLKKYDEAFHGAQAKAVSWERDKHTVAANAPTAEWEGHCNGYSAAAQRHAEPRVSVKRGTTNFTPKDIKALLAEVYMSAKFYILGGSRCNRSGTQTSPSRRVDPYFMGECDDVNPASFHAALANWIGIQKHTVIVDTSANDQVWNFPHFKYQASQATVSTQEAMRLITGVASSTYRFNSAAVSFRSVTMTVTYSRAFVNEYLTNELKPSEKHESKSYKYVLELDQSGRMIGGEWVGTSQQEHPDFIWVALEPASGDGSESSANPHVNPTEVIKLWAESIGEDPNNPPLDIMEPAIATAWGVFSKFDVTINGGRSGAVFLGRPLVLKVNRTSPLHGDLTLEVSLNGKVVATEQGSGSDRLNVALPSPGRGGHSLEFLWKRGADVIDHQRLRFIAH